MLTDRNQISKQHDRISLEGANLTSLNNTVPSKQYLIYTGMHYDTRKQIQVVDFLQIIKELRQLDLSSNKMTHLLPASYKFEPGILSQIVSLNISDNPFSNVK